MTENEIRERAMLLITDLPEGVRRGYISSNYKHVDPLLPDGILKGMKSDTGYSDGALAYGASFPDYSSKAKWIVVDDDKSASRWEWSGTFTGKPFFGYEATGQRVEFTGLTMWRWENGQVVEGITLYDLVGFVRQISNGEVDVRPFKPE